MKRKTGCSADKLYQSLENISATHDGEENTDGLVIYPGPGSANGYR